jgi:cell division protein FtsL
MKYLVIQMGGSIGEISNLQRYHGEAVYRSFDTKEEANNFVREARKRLTKTEKMYYKIRYRVVAVKPYEKQ